MTRRILLASLAALLLPSPAAVATVDYSKVQPMAIYGPLPPLTLRPARPATANTNNLGQFRQALNARIARINASQQQIRNEVENLDARARQGVMQLRHDTREMRKDARRAYMAGRKEYQAKLARKYPQALASQAELNQAQQALRNTTRFQWRKRNRLATAIRQTQKRDLYQRADVQAANLILTGRLRVVADTQNLAKQRFLTGYQNRRSQLVRQWQSAQAEGNRARSALNAAQQAGRRPPTNRAGPATPARAQQTRRKPVKGKK